MTGKMDRRQFLGASAALGTLVGTSSRARAEEKKGANDTIVVAVMGTGGRGTTHAAEFTKLPGAEVAYVCDVDRDRAERAAAAVGKAGGKTPKAVQDFREILDDKAVDALVIATCNHWHAPAGILACKAGKHVYVEKPCSHNAREGELLVEAARKYDRVVQMGNQRRSWPKVMEGIEQVRSGAIGRVYFGRGFYNANRGSIGKGKEAPVPEGLDYALWEGPAPHKPFHDNYLHYNWHWFWHWGNGELGNNGVHYLDVLRWGLDVDYPTRVTSSGGRYRFEDDQETPDTHVVCFDFDGGKTCTWEGLSCNGFRPGGNRDEIVFTGTEGSLGITGGGYTIYDLKGKTVKTVKGSGGDTTHQTNFLDTIRGQAEARSEIEGGHKSTLLCHLGNIAHRTGRTLNCDPKNGHILDDSEAMGYWSREYAKGWEPSV